MQQEAIPLLRTKLDLPAPHAHTILRERLFLLAPNLPETRLLLLSAPAGFGKTTFLATWCQALAAQRGAAVAWLALDESDNDPTRFLAYLVGSLAQALAPEQLPIETPGAGAEAVLTQLVNALATRNRELVLVLDDYHLISAPAVHAAVAFLLEHLPNRHCLAIGSRADPPLPLARLRAREQLVELRAAELRFTPEEIQQFFTLCKLAIAPEELAAIGAYVEGWPAGLQLVALALRAVPQPWADETCNDAPNMASDRLLSRLNRSQQQVFAYLAEDVFERQPAHRKAFMLQTAILDRMCGPLCDAVLGVGDGGWGMGDAGLLPSPIPHPPSPDSYSRLILEEIEHANLFVLPLDDEKCWYRYHHLFRAFLRARLDHEPPSAVAHLHQRASAWYEQQRLLPSAVEHALAAGDLARAAELIEASAATLVERGEYVTLHGWLDRIPEAALARWPALCLWAAWAALLAGQVERVAPLFQQAERAWQGAGARRRLGELADLHAHLARLRHDPQATIAAAEKALLNIPEDQLTLRANSLLALGAGQLLAGDLGAAGATLADAYTQCQAHNFLGMLGALVCLGDLAAQRGQLSAAAEWYRQVLTLAPARPIWERWAAAVALGDLARERNELDRALELLQPALAAAEQAGAAVYLPNGYVALARTQLARSDDTAAAMALDRALQAARRLESPAYIRQIRAEQARLALAQRDLVAAQRWQAEAAPEMAGQPGATPATEALVLARVLIAQGRADPRSAALHTAQTLLAQLREQATAQRCAGTLIEISALLALAAAAAGRRDQALITLRQALLLAQPEGYARIFLDEGAPMRSLLADCQLQIAQVNSGLEREAARSLQAYVERLLAAQPRTEGRGLRAEWESTASVLSPQSSALVEPLSDRELEVLRLITGGASNQAIAATLMISIGTVKSHINHILGKLESHNRTEAVARARALGLIAS